MSPDTAIQTMVDRIVQVFHPRRVILLDRTRVAPRLRRVKSICWWCDEAENKRTLAIEMGRTLSDLPVGKEIVVTTAEEIRRLGHLVGTVLRPALREGKVVYERP